MPVILTTAQAAQEISDDPHTPGDAAKWQVRRLYELGILPEPPKFGNKRMIAREDIPRIVAAMRDRGWLPEVEEPAHA